METEASRPFDGQEETEAEKVERWRLESLLKAGYAQDVAETIAKDNRMDLHEAYALKKKGCPDDLALRILAPDDEREMMPV